MQQLSNKAFKDIILNNPWWAKDLKELVVVQGDVWMEEYPITHLSEYLHFTKDKDGKSANFAFCKDLKIATGTFEGFVNFQNTGVEKIENLKILGTDYRGNAADFWDCKNLKVGEGTYPGWVGFNSSGIERIGELKITSGKVKRTLPPIEYPVITIHHIENFAEFKECHKLKDANTKFLDEKYKLDESFKNILKKKLAQENLRKTFIRVQEIQFT